PLRPDARLERGERHALDVLERPQDQLAMRRPRRRDAEAAVADHDRGDAVPRGDREHAVPEDLRVVVRVDVDEARRDDEPARVERARGRAAHLPYLGDSAATYADVALAARSARPVDQSAAANGQVEPAAHRGHPTPAPRPAQATCTL